MLAYEVVAAVSSGQRQAQESWFFSIQITIYTGVQQACCAMVEFGTGRAAGGAPGAAGWVSTAGAGTRQWVLGQARAGTMAWCWYVQGARGEGARRGPVLASARAGNINLRRKYIKRPDARVDIHAASHRVGVDESMYRTREQQRDGPGPSRI